MKRSTVLMPLAMAALAGAAIALALGFTGRWDDVANLPARLGTRWVKPQAGEERPLRKRERDALRGLRDRLSGRIVWSSNRSGNHELYLYEIQTGQVRRLTDNPHVDFSSRFSPDGREIVFARSQREWVSFREDTAWDVWIVDADGSNERLVATGGYHPTWSADGQSVYFQRGGLVIRHRLADGDETVLFDAERSVEGLGFGDPTVSSSGRLALAAERIGAIVLDGSGLEYRRLTEDHVCQTLWVPGTEDLLWMEPEGNGGTRIRRAAADGSRSEVFMDLPGERSHEYFPWLSDDGKWLVWGAAAEGHEHDRADYEIYLWEVGTPWSEAIRLTYHSGNDQWPDLHVDL